jgi:Fe2+ transport system protein FeoA
MGIKKLNLLNEGDRAKILKVRGRGEINRRLRDMGVKPGVEVEVEGRATLGDPMAVKIMGYRLSLRENEAEQVEVEVLDGP